MTTDESNSAHETWWGTFTLQEESGGRWDVGPSSLWLYRTAHEWRLMYQPSSGGGKPDPMADRSQATVPVSEDEMEAILHRDDQDIRMSRHGFRHTDPHVSLRPALADRPVITRPEHPLHVPPGETITLYVSTPVWLQVVLPDSDRPIEEFPSHRMSDTWFGTSTTSGEFCYATRTAGRLRLDRLPLRSHRAVTPLKIANSAAEPLLLERVQLPVPYLKTYVTARGALWTQAVRMDRTEGRQGADVQIEEGLPAEVEEAESIGEPREQTRRGLVTSTFSAVEAFFGS